MGMNYSKRDAELAVSGVNRLPMYAKGDMRCDNPVKQGARGNTVAIVDHPDFQKSYLVVTEDEAGARANPGDCRWCY